MPGVGEIRAQACHKVRKGLADCPAHQTHCDPSCEVCTVVMDAAKNMLLLEELVVEVNNVLRYGRLRRSVWSRLADALHRVEEGAHAIAHLYEPPWVER